MIVWRVVLLFSWNMSDLRAIMTDVVRTQTCHTCGKPRADAAHLMLCKCGMSCIMLKDDVMRMAYCFCPKELMNEQDGIR